MSEKSGLALVKPDAQLSGVTGGLSINGLAEMERAARMLAQARGIVPRAYADNPAAIAAVIMTGFELGIAPMTAMRELHLIEGKVSLSATLMLTLARRAGIKHRWVKTDATVATIGVTVPGQPEQTLSFTIEEARAAGLANKDNWKKHTAAMLRARATSAAIRAFCPEAIGGSVYESESGELTDGEPIVARVTDMTPPHAKPPAPRPAAQRPPIGAVKSGEELAAWLADGRDERSKLTGETRERAAKAIKARAKALGVDESIALEWAGLHYDPTTGEVPADQEPPPDAQP